MGYLSLVTFVALAASAVAGPLSISGPCARQCTESAKFQYTPGTSYFFDYESDAVTTMQGATKEESRLHLKTKVEIHAVSKCDFVMRLSGVSLEYSDPNNVKSRRPVESVEHFRQSLERYTLRFSFQDGSVDTVCPADGETPQALNIKRGILSTLQTSAGSLESPERVIETDVSGKCLVNYEPLGRGWNSVTVRRIKDLSTCTERHNAETAIQMNPFTDNKETKSTPLIRGMQECQQVFKHNRIESVICSESHVFRPFSRQDGGAMTKVTQALTYNSEKKTSFTGSDYSNLQKAMTYEHESGPEERDRRTRQVETMLADLCTAAQDDIRPSVPAKFTSFVYGLRQLEHTDLVNMFRRVERICPDNTKAKKLYLDGVSMAGTPGAMKFIVDLIQRGEMPEKEVDLWISTLAFVNKPDKETLVSLLPLLDGKRLDVILPVSAVVHTVCNHDTECGQKNEVRQIVQKIAQLVGNSCNGDKKKVMLALKALGNMGVPFETEEKLQACAQNANLDIEIRVAAIQAYRRLSCDVMRSPIMDLYMNQEENVEVRIASFLNVMHCPSETVFMRIKDAMDAEKIKQVGSFVMSYLKNIEDKIQFKSEIRDIISNVEYLNKFESDMRKFSRNFQNSFFFNSLDSGMSMDSNLIFDTTSYLPRTAMLNLTVDIMGGSFNLFEMEGRFEGLEKMVERMFGPNGYFSKDTPKDNTRAKKSIADNKIEKMDRKYDVKSNFEKDASVSLDMKIFGNSLWYKKFQEGNIGSEAFGAMDIMVELAKEQEVELTKSFMFLDTTVHIPTGSGLPLVLAVNGSAVANLKMSGKVDTRNLDNIDVHGKIQPSGAVMIGCRMSVDAAVAKTELKMLFTMHTSTLLDGLVEVRGGKVYQARMNMPRDQIEIFDIQSQIFLNNGQEEREQKSMVEQNSVFSECTGRFTNKPLGVELCGELQLPAAARKNAPLYPFSGPAKAKVFLRKTDPTLTSYNVEMRWTEDKNGREVTGQHLVMSFNTPESKIDREISAEFHLNKQDSTVAMKLKVPNKKIALSGKRTMNEKEKRLSLAVSVDDMEKYSMTTSLITDSDEAGMTYRPTLEFHGARSRWLNVRSTISVKSNKYSGDINIEELTATPIRMEGEITTGERNRYELNAMLESYALSTKVKGHVQLRNGFSSKCNIQYRIMESRKETLDFSTKVRDLSANGLTKYTMSTTLSNSAMPEITTQLALETQLTQGHIENSFNLKFGDGRIRRLQEISMSEIIKYQANSWNSNSLDGTFRLTYPEKDIDFALQMKHAMEPNSLQNTVNLKYAPGREASSLVDLKLETNPMKATGDIQLKYPGREMRLQSTVNKKQGSEYEGTMTAQWQRGKQIRASGNLRDGSNRNGRDYLATIEVVIPNYRPISVNTQLTAMPGRYLISADGEFAPGSYNVKGEYTTNSAWNHKASAMVKLPRKTYTAEGILQKNGEAVTGKVDVNVPGFRRVTGTVEVSNGAKVKTGAMDIMWDADADQNKRVQLDGEYRLNADGTQGKFNLKSPVKTLSGSYNANYAGQYKSGIMRGNLQTVLEWENNQKFTMDIGGNAALKQSRRQLNGEFKVTTPVNGYENMMVTAQHTDTWPDWNNKLTIQWMQNRKIILGSEGKIRSDSSSTLFDTSLRMNTPFRGYESMSLRQIYEKRSSEITSTSSVQWAAGKTIELGVSGAIVGENAVRAGANLTTPFSNLRDLTMSFSNSFSRSNMNTDFDVMWNTQNRLGLNFDGRSVLTGKKHTCSAELKFQSTIRNYENFNSKVVYNKDAGAASVNSDLRWNNNRVTVGVNGANKNSYYGYNMEGKMEYSSNFRNYEKGELKLAHVSDSSKFTTNFESTLPYRHSLNMKLLGNMPNYREMDSSLALTSTFAEAINYQVAYKVDKERLTANAMATYGPQKMTADVSGTSKIGYGSWDLDYRVNINTPFQGLEDMKLAASQTRKDLQFSTRVQASKNQDTINMNHDLKIEDMLNFLNNLRITTPFRSMRSVELNTRQTGKPGEYKHITDAMWAGKKATLSMEMNNRSQRKGRNFEVRLNAKSPFQVFSNMDFEFQHEDDERVYKPRLSIQWNENNKIAVDAVLNNNRYKKVDASLSATSSFPGYENLMYTGKYDITTKQKTAEMSYKWNERSNKAVTIRGTLEVDSKNGMVDIVATSPVRGFETVQMKTDYAFSGNENALNILGQYGDKKYSFNGKHVKNNNGNEVNAQVSTPINGYERLAAFASYAINKNELNSEVSYEWGTNNKVVLNTDYRSRNGKIMGKLSLNTPFNGYKKMALKVEGNTETPKKTGSVLIQWDPSNTIQANGEFESDFSRFGRMNVDFRSPFDGFKEVSMNGEVKMIPSEFNCEATLQWMPDKKVTGNVLLKPTQVIVSFDTPYRPYKNVRFVSELKKQAYDAAVSARLEWDNTKEAKVSGNYKVSEKMWEGQVEVTLPIDGPKTGSISGSFMNDNRKMMEGHVEINTPWERFDIRTLIRNNNGNHEITTSFAGPNTKVSLNGNLEIRNYREMEGNVKLDSNFAPIPAFTAKCSYKNDDWRDIRVNAGLNDVHMVSGSFKNDQTYQVEGSIETPLLRAKRATVSMNFNTKDIRNMEATLAFETPSARHNLDLSEKYTKSGFEAEMKLNSPAVSGQIVNAKVFYSNKKNKNIQGKFSVIENRKPHSVDFSFNSETRDIVGKLNIECDMILSDKLSIAGKVSRPTDNTLETTITAQTGPVRHSLVANGKILDNAMELSGTLDTPIVSSRPVTLTANLNNNNYRTIEGSASMSCSAGESRVSFNVRRDGMRDLEAFFTMNLPVQSLSMLRVDMKMKNDGLKSMEGSLDIKSSLEWMRAASMSGKMKNTENAWDTSLNFKLPVRNWNNIALLATVHKNEDLSRVSPRITISLPNNKYVFYGNYEASEKDLQASIGSEWDNLKSELSVEMHPNEYRATLLTPIRGHERYTAIVNYRNEKGKRSSQITIEDPKSRKYTADMTLNFHNMVNFIGEANLKMPVDGWREISTKLRQSFRRGRWAMNFEHNMERSKKVALIIEHDGNPLSGTVQVVTPVEALKSMKLNYNWQSSSDVNGKMEVEVNNRNLLRMELEQIYQSATRAYSKSVQVEFPTFPYTLIVSSKPMASGSEFTVKSVLPRRTLNFQTMYQMTSTHFSHGSQLTLDESNGQTISYEIRSSPTRQGKELYARLNMPIRSLELRTIHEKSSTGRTASADFFWDAARDQTRHMKLAMEHVDNSNRYNFAHKIRLIASHPQLSKDIVLATECMVSPKEIYGKTEVEYSRLPQHNLFLEARLSSKAQSRSESRYSATMAARHAATNLDMKMTAEVANTQQEMAAEMQMNYLDRNLRQQIQELRTKIQKVKQNIEFMARSNENKINILGRMFHQDQEFTLALEQSINNESPVHSHFRWNNRHSNMDLNITSPYGNRVHLKAAMPGDHIEAEIGHIVSGRQYKDGSFYLGLKDSKVLQSRINWRPEVFTETTEELSKVYEHNVPRLMSVMRGIREEISNEIDRKSDMMTKAVVQETRPFVTEISKEFKKMRVDSQRASNELNQMYRRDEFYVKSAADYADNVIESISQYYVKIVKAIKHEYEIFRETMSMTLDIMKNIYDGMIEDLARMMKNYEKAVRRTLANWSRAISQFQREYLITAAERMMDYVGVVAYSVGSYVESAGKWIWNYVSRYAPAAERYWKIVLKEAKEVAAWLMDVMKEPIESVAEHPVYKAMNEYAVRVMDTIAEFQSKISYDQMLRSTRMFMGKSAENVAAAYKYVREHPNINYMNEMAAGVFEQGRHLASELGMNTMIVTVMEELFQKTQKLAWNSVREMAEEYTSIQKNAKIVYQPENGKMELEVRLPVMKKNLKQLLDINSYPQIQRLRELGSEISFGDFCIWDTYYKYKRYMDITYWLPPFKAQAMIVGSQHYMTFDNFDFEFAGECSYLLARDFVDGNFTVTVNYVRDNDRVVRKSLNVYSDGVKIEVSRDNKVTIDDRKVELPQEVGQTRMTMEDGVIRVSSSQGFEVKCIFEHDICTLEINGFYFGKTGGLFGTNNYEPAYDMMTPEKKIAQNLEEFSDSWQVGSAQCTKSRNMAERAPVDRRAQEKCEKLFKNYNSEFRSGFKQVNPEPFLRMCVSDLSPLRETEQKMKICSSAAAYIERCRQEGVNLKMPKHCVRCERLNADPMESGDFVKITSDEPVRAADVVFIVEEKECNRNVPAVLSKLAQSVDDGFRKAGYREVNFAVVGFGGEGIHSEPHVVTSDSQIFASVRNVEVALNNLPTGNGDSNIFMALRYAAGLPFMTGSTKTFVLAKCSACKVEEMKADYSEMLRTMLDSDITLHLLMDHEFETRPPNKPEQAKRVLGFDRKHAYTTKDTKNTELRGDRDLLAQLKTPKDLCVPLALEVNGSFFSMARLQDKRTANKKTVEVMSKRIMSSAKPAECQICECIATQNGVGKSVCQRCVSPVVAQLVSDEYSPMMYSMDNEIA